MRADLVSQRLQNVVTDGVTVTPGRGRARVPPAERAGEGRVREDRGGRGTGGADRCGGRGALPGEAGSVQVPRAPRRVLRSRRQRGPAVARHRDRGGTSPPTTARTRRSSGRRKRRAQATSW
jgi:hypothetical protein